jgi:FXSXX-COOH protein
MSIDEVLTASPDLTEMSLGDPGVPSSVVDEAVQRILGEPALSPQPCAAGFTSFI